MSTVKRTKDDIDVLEHTMQGVHTSEIRGKSSVSTPNADLSA